MSDAVDVKFNLKVVINKQKTKVLFAESDSDFADVLLSFLALPLGTVVRVMNKHYGDNAPVLGSLTTLYNGLSDLDSAHFWSEGGKQMLLNPRSWFDVFGAKLKLYVSEPQPVRCGSVLGTEMKLDRSIQTSKCSDGVLNAKPASFITCDDMRITPEVMGSILETLNTLGITETKDFEMRNVTLGLNEIMDLLKGMFTSRTPLTDLILSNKQNDNMKLEPGIPLDRIEKVAASDSKKMILKVVVQKSTNKLLFAHAEEDFVDFLFSLLTIPLGGVESLLDNNTRLQSIDKLYTSLSSINDRYFENIDTKSMLLNPKLPHGYISRGQILPLTEEEAPWLPNLKHGRKSITNASFKYPKGDGNYVMGPMMYMITDDLTVTPLCMSSSLFRLNELNFPLSDVEELKFHIGLEEALRILKASLTSTSALTDGLLLLNKTVKQEQ